MYDFWRRVKITSLDGCHIWTGGKSDRGYGVFTYQRKIHRAHKFLYERFVGPVPKGLELDHVCRRRDCVNIRHLRPVTHQENMLNGRCYETTFKKKTHCPSGHEYKEGNIGIGALRNGKRYPYCRECRKAYKRRRYLERKTLGTN